MKTPNARSFVLLAVLSGGAVLACSSASSTSPAIEAPIGTIDGAIPPRADGGASDTSTKFTAEMRTLLEIEDQHVWGDARLKAFLASVEPEIAARAAEVAGQVRDPETLPLLLGLLKSSPSGNVRGAAAEALQWFDADAVRPALHAAAQSDSAPEVIAGVFYALGTVGNADSVALVSTFLASPGLSVQSKIAAANGLALMLRGKASGETASSSNAAVEAMIKDLAHPDARVRVHTGFALREVLRGASNRFFPTYGPQLIAAWATLTDPNVRVRLGGLLVQSGTPEAIAIIRAGAVSDPSAMVRQNMTALFPASDVSTETLGVLLTALAGTDILAATNAVDALTARSEQAMMRVAEVRAVYTSSPSPWLRSKIFVLLQTIDPDRAVADADAAMSDPMDLVRAEAIHVVAKRKPATHAQAILDAATSESAPVRIAALTAIASEIPEDLVNLGAITPVVKAALNSGKRERVTYAMWSVQARKLDSLIPDLVAATKAAKPEESEVLTYGLQLMGELKVSSELAYVDSNIEHKNPWIGQYATDAHKAITAEDVSSRVRKIIKVTEPTPSEADIAAALAGEVEFETSRGKARMKLTAVNPVAAAKYVATVKAGELDGIRMHRNIPVFVGQFGDPSFTGSGGTPMHTRTLRTSRFEMEPGTFAIARAYVDDDGSQVFYNTSWNVSLTGNYTPLGMISSGKEVMDVLEYGDTFTKVRFIPAP